MSTPGVLGTVSAWDQYGICMDLSALFSFLCVCCVLPHEDHSDIILVLLTNRIWSTRHFTDG